MTESIDTGKLNLDALLKNIINNPAAAMEQGDKLLEGLSLEEIEKIQKEAKSIANGPLGADLRKKLRQQGFNQRRMKKMIRTNKTLVKGKRGEECDKGVIITESRRLKYFNIYRSQESECINNVVGGIGQSIPLTQRLQNSEYKDKGIKFAYNPRSAKKENRRSKRFIHTKYPIRGDIIIYRDLGSLSFADVEIIETILAAASDGQRDMQVRKTQAAAKEAGLDTGLLRDENCVFGTKEEERDYGKDEDYLIDSEDENEEEQKEEEEETDSDDEEIEEMLAI